VSISLERSNISHGNILLRLSLRWLILGRSYRCDILVCLFDLFNQEFSLELGYFHFPFNIIFLSLLQFFLNISDFLHDILDLLPPWQYFLFGLWRFRRLLFNLLLWVCFPPFFNFILCLFRSESRRTDRSAPLMFVSTTTGNVIRLFLLEPLLSSLLLLLNLILGSLLLTTLTVNTSRSWTFLGFLP